MPRETYAPNKLENRAWQLDTKETTAQKKAIQKMIDKQPKLTPYDRGVASCNERITSLNKSITDFKERIDLLNMFTGQLNLIRRITHNDKVLSETPAQAIVNTLLQISFEEITLEMVKLEKAIYISKKNVDSDQIGKHWSDRYEAITMKAIAAVEKMVEAELYTDSDYAVYRGQADTQMEFIRSLCV